MTPPANPVRTSTDTDSTDPQVRRFRREAGLTQQDLAAAVQVSRQTIIAMERGDYAPSVYLALKVARALGVTAEVLWGQSTS